MYVSLFVAAFAALTLIDYGYRDYRLRRFVDESTPGNIDVPIAALREKLRMMYGYNHVVSEIDRVSPA